MSSKEVAFLHEQARKVVHNVFLFVTKLSEREISNIPSDIVECTSVATGVSEQTVRRVISEFGDPNRKPKTRVNKLSAFKNITKAQKLIVRNYIYDHFYVAERVVPSVEQLYSKLKEDNQFPGTIKNLKRVLEDFGFTKLRINRNLNVLIEKTKFQLQRVQYCKDLTKYRSEGRTIVYTGLSAVGNVPSSITSGDIESHSTKCQRIILGNAISSDGYVPNSQILFQETTRGAYHNTYHRWMCTKVVPNLPPDSVVVIDDVLCNNILEDYVITMQSSRSDMEAWLAERNIAFSEDMFKLNLYELVTSHEDYKIQYKINTIIEVAGHKVLRIPKIYLDLSPLLIIFEDINRFVNENKDNILNYSEFKKLVTEKYGHISTIESKILLERVKKIEAKYSMLDYLVDDLTDELADKVVEDDFCEPYADMMYSDLDDYDDNDCIMDIGIKDEEVKVKYEPDDIELL